MDSKKFLIGTIVGGVAFFLLGYLIYGIALADIMASHAGSATGVQRAMEDLSFGAIITGNLFSAALLTYIFLKWAGIQTFAAGITAGATVGFLNGMAFDMTMYGTSNVLDLTGVLIDVAAATVLYGMGGGVIGWVLGTGKAKS